MREAGVYADRTFTHADRLRADAPKGIIFLGRPRVRMKVARAPQLRCQRAPSWALLRQQLMTPSAAARFARARKLEEGAIRPRLLTVTQAVRVRRLGGASGTCVMATRKVTRFGPFEIVPRTAHLLRDPDRRGV